MPIHINGKAFTLELDTATGGNFISTRVWTELDKPKLQQAQWRYHSASKHPLPVIGAFTAEAKYGDVSKSYPVSFLVSEIPDLNLFGRDAIKAMRISLDDLLFSVATFHKTDYRLLAIPQSDRVDRHLQQVCHELCTDSASFSSPSWVVSVVCNSRLNLDQTQGPSANHAPFHLQERISTSLRCWNC